MSKVRKMRAHKRKLICLVLLALMLACPAQASESEILSRQSSALELDKLTGAAGAYAYGGDLSEGVDLDQGIQGILDTGSDALWGVVRKAIRSGILLLVVVMLCAMADGLYAGTGAGSGLEVVPIVGALAITAIAVADVNSLIGMGREALNSMDSFSKVLLPTLAAATAAGGSPAGAAARQMATVFFSDILLTLIDRLLLPLVYTHIAACVAYAAVGNEGLKRVAGLLKWVVTSSLALIMLVFVGYLTVSGSIAGSADAVAVKAAKFAVSGMVPVVGGILSDAAETVLAGAGLLKNTVGVFGMLVVLSMCIIPFLQLGVHYLAYKLTAALSATVAEGRIVGLIDSIGGAFGLVLGMTGACTLLLMISMVSAISVVTT